MKVLLLVGFLIVGVAAQYGGSSALALAAASIDGIIDASALAAASATGDDASASAAAAASASDGSASASAAATASVGTADGDKEAEKPMKKQIKGLPHSKVIVVPVKKEKEPEPAPKATPVIVITTDEKTCDDILEDLLECADGSADVPFECLEKSDITVEDLADCGYLAPVPEPEPAPTPKASPTPAPLTPAVPELAPIPEPESCTDVPPDSEYTCAEQVAFGNCDASFVVDGKFCLKSCGKC